MTPGTIGFPGKWPFRYHSSPVNSCSATARTPGSSSVTRSIRRKGSRCGMSASIAVRSIGARMTGAFELTTVLWGGPSGLLRVGVGGSLRKGARHSAKALGPTRTLRRRSPGQRLDADRVDEVRRHLPGAEELAREDLLVRADVRGDADDRELVERALHPRDGLRPVAPP